VVQVCCKESSEPELTEIVDILPPTARKVSLRFEDFAENHTQQTEELLSIVRQKSIYLRLLQLLIWLAK